MDASACTPLSQRCQEKKTRSNWQSFCYKAPIHHGFNKTTVTALPVETGIHPLEGLEFEPIVHHQPDLVDALNGTFAMQMIDNLLDLDHCVFGASPVGESAEVVGASPIGKFTNMSCDTPSQDKSLDLPGSPNFQSNNDGN